MAVQLATKYGAALPVTYRRRATNPGFKAGNIRDFCDRWGAAFDYALVFDADSFMTPRVMLRLVRIMKANPVTQIPAEMLLIFRVLGLMSGLQKRLDSTVSMFDTIIPYAEAQAADPSLPPGVRAGESAAG